MKRESPDIDVILYVLKHTLEAYPGSVFVQSLLKQYQERGSLSRKQLEGLHKKASQVKAMHVEKLATVQAIILRKHANHRSVATKQAVEATRDEVTGRLIADILEKYPGHKRVLFFRMKYDKNEGFSVSEKAELEKFYGLLCKTAGN